jgi:hypothetical protein
MGVTLASPLVRFDSAWLYGYGLPIGCIYPAWGILTIGMLSTLVALVEIFCYKKRKLQIKLSNMNALLIILSYITASVYTYVKMQKYELTFERIDYGLIFPIIAYFFNVLAKRKIQQDEKLVRSLDRIR